MRRRRFTGGLALALCHPPGLVHGASGADGVLEAGLADIEREVRGRLGVALFDLESGRVIGHRLDERFPMCSTFKWLLAAAVLQRVDAGTEHLDRRLVFQVEQRLGWAPVTRAQAGGAGMTVAELCEAAITQSDNGAANALLTALGGPAAVTRCARGLGDTVTRLDRLEPELNEGRPGDPRDTTSPRAMAHLLDAALRGNTLAAASRARLLAWMDATQTGLRRLRAGLPADWKSADKTGTGPRGSTNDVAYVRPPARAPLCIAAYLTECAASEERREQALAQVGRLVARRAGAAAAKAG